MSQFTGEFDDPPFIELRHQDTDAGGFDSVFTEAFVTEVQPCECSALVKRVSSIFKNAGRDPDLPHLKRVRKVKRGLQNGCSSVSDDCDERDVDRNSTESDLCLEVLLGSMDAIKSCFRGKENVIKALKEEFHIDVVRKITVPSRYPETKAEWEKFQEHWSTVYDAQKTRSFQEEKLALSHKEYGQMSFGMMEAIMDAKNSIYSVGVVVVSPQTGDVVARSRDECFSQGIKNIDENPLTTPMILALQAISRAERNAAIEQGMDTFTFQAGQYLCTGLDVYTTVEPTTFEAMALVHSRVRRIVFGYSSNDKLGGLTNMFVHNLPGTNHKYRAFKCRPDSKLGKLCQKLS